MRRGAVLGLASALALVGLSGHCLGQGTMTVTFEGQLRGTEQQIGVYSELGMQFGGLTPQSLWLSGGGIPGYPDNGTGYLENPAGSMRFGFNTFPPTGSLTPVNFLSFDAAECHSFPPSTLTVVGYKIQIMGPFITVTNVFTVSSQTFQTFHLDSSFTGVFQVDILNSSFSLDNVVISGVPEPSACALVLLGAACLVSRSWARSRMP